MKKSTMNIDSCCKLLSVTTILAILFESGNSDLATVPRDTVAVVGQTTYFNCSTSFVQSPKIHWQYYDKHIYAGGKFLNPYERFRIEIDNTTGSYNLVIPSVRREDAGIYRCLDNQGFGDIGLAELVVLDGNPLCNSDTKTDRIVGPNNCNIDPEDVNLSCSTTYNGKVAPILKWKRLGDSGSIGMERTTCTNSSNRVDCNLTIKADHLLLDGSSYICHSELTPSINCTSDAIDIIYSFNDFRLSEKSLNDELSCKANSSEQCNNRWIWNAFDGSSTMLWSQSTVTAEVPGLYRCESDCYIGGKQCAVSAMMVYVGSGNGTAIDDPLTESSALETSSCADSQNTIIFIIVLAILSVLLLACIICLVACLIKVRKSKEKQDHVLDMSYIHVPSYPDVTRPPTQTMDGNNHVDSKKVDLHDESFDDVDGLGTENESEELMKLPNGSLKDELETSRKKNAELQKQLDDREIELLKKIQEAIELKEKLEKAEREKEALNEKVKRLSARNCELGRSLCLPPKDPIEYSFKSKDTIKTLASQGSKNIGVCGVAVLDRELFVISDKHPEIEVYDMSTFKCSRKLQLHGFIDPGDIAACHQNKWLYIVDWTDRGLENKMLRLDINGKDCTQQLRLVDDECRLFVTSDSNVLVTFHRSRKIVEYTPDWTVVFQVNVKGDIYPIHSVKLSNGLLAICHGTANETIHRVCIVSDDGIPITSFGGQRGAGVGNVNFPTYLTVDRHDNILLVDRDNGRVLMLDSRLQFTAELLSKKDKLRRSRVILLDEKNCELIVADCNDKFLDGQVLVFDVR